MTRFVVAAGGFFALLLCFAVAPAEATVIGVCNDTGDTNPASNGSCSKSVTLTGDQLTIELSNTTPIAIGGFLTADAFFLPDGITASLFSTTNTAFTLSQGPSVPPFENQGFVFNWLLSSTNTWAGGGNPATGIAAGSSATFVLTLAGDLTGLTEADVLNSEAIRFRGFAQGGSDKDLVGDNPPDVPEPTTLLLLAGGFVATATRRFWSN